MPGGQNLLRCLYQFGASRGIGEGDDPMHFSGYDLHELPFLECPIGSKPRLRPTAALLQSGAITTIRSVLGRIDGQ